MSTRELTVVLKGFHFPQTGLDKNSALGQLIARSKTTEGALPVSIDALLFSIFGLEQGPDADIPVAAVTRLLDLGVVDKGWWLRADPVHLVAGRRGLLLAGNTALALTGTEAEALAREISNSVLEEGWILKAPNPHRWYLKPAQPADIRTTPIDVVLGKDVESYLPVGNDAKAWHTYLNEIQILLHTSQVNSDRESRDKIAVNSVWFWGGGTMPTLKASPWTSVCSDDVVSLALARLSETTSRKIPHSFSDWLEHAPEGKHLLVLGDIESLDWLQPFEEEWAQSLTTALKQNDIDRLTIYLGTVRKLVLTPGDVKSRWSWRFPFGRG